MSDISHLLPLAPESVKGFLDPAEGAALYEAALLSSKLGACLEVGTYCGKSALYIGAACRESGTILYAVDHHRGSEENQPGWEHHDPDTWNEELGAMDTLPFLRKTLFKAGLEQTVIPIVGPSKVIAQNWGTPLGFLFIDGGHAREHAQNDYRYWTRHLVPGGTLAIHDVFPNPEDGGRPPFEIYEMALGSGLYEEVKAVKSLRILRRL